MGAIGGLRFPFSGIEVALTGVGGVMAILQVAINPTHLGRIRALRPVAATHSSLFSSRRGTFFNRAFVSAQSLVGEQR
ncbi:hypothetical protein BDV12DRAFT_100009 [Aspergillus spectabilis]